jgi:hypothetical protein
MIDHRIGARPIRARVTRAAHDISGCADTFLLATGRAKQSLSPPCEGGVRGGGPGRITCVDSTRRGGGPVRTTCVDGRWHGGGPGRTACDAGARWGHRPLQSRKQRHQFISLLRLNDIVGIKPKRIITGRVRQCLIPRRREVVDPRKIEHPCPELTRDFLGPIGTARIHDDDFIENPRDRRQTPRKIVLLIFHDHGQADRRTAALEARPRIRPTRSASEGSG